MRTLSVDEENGMVFRRLGALGGVCGGGPDKEYSLRPFRTAPAVIVRACSNTPQGSGSAMIYYTFDNTMNSSATYILLYEGLLDHGIRACTHKMDSHRL